MNETTLMAAAVASGGATGSPRRHRGIRTGLGFMLLALLVWSGPFRVGTAALQQSSTTPRIGFLSPGFPPNWADLRDFREGLREQGYVEGENITIEARFAEGQDERLASLAAELVSLPVDVLVATSAPGVRAARDATRTIPIVMSMSSAIGAQEFVASLARPGGNVTGISRLDPVLGGKRLELLKGAFPQIRRVGVLWHPDGPDKLFEFEEIQRAARQLNVDLEPLEVYVPEQLEGAFETAAKEGVEALIVLPGFLTVSQLPKITSLAAERRLPAMYGVVENARAGGLMAYGSSNADSRRRLAVYVDRIIKGAKPGDLPIEQPRFFQLVVNLKTATALGLTISPAILNQANEVIE